MSSTNSGPAVSTTPNIGAQMAPAGSASTPFDLNNVGTLNGVAIGSGSVGRAVKMTSRYARIGLPNRLNYRQLMASAPVPTFTTAHTIASPQSWPATSGDVSGVLSGSFFSYTRAGGFTVAGTGGPQPGFVKATSVNYGTAGGQQANSFQVSFMHDGSAIELSVLGNGGALLVKVDDQYLTATPQAIASDGNLYYYYINFGSTKLRRIDVQLCTSSWGGVYTAATDTICPAPIRGPRTIFMGDSFTEGTGANSAIQSYVSYLADALGWDDVWQSGVGSTGYLAYTTGKLTFRQRISTDVVPFSPELVIVCGGINDNGQTYSSIQSEAAALFGALQTQLPAAMLVATSPFWRAGAGGVVSGIWSVRDAIKAAAASAGIAFVDLLELPLPLNYAPSTATLTANTGGTITVDKAPALRGTYKFSNGDRFQVKSYTGSGPFVITPDAMQSAHLAGEIITQVGDCFWTGTGRVAVAPPTLSLGAASAGGTFAAGSYFWKVTATNSLGETTGSNEVTATLTLNQQQALSWAASTGATSYKVYRGATAGAENVLVATIAGTSYTDTGSAGSAASVPASNTTGPTGYGNADVYVSTDGTHPSPAGHSALGQALASGLVQALA